MQSIVLPKPIRTKLYIIMETKLRIQIDSKSGHIHQMIYKQNGNISVQFATHLCSHAHAIRLQMLSVVDEIYIIVLQYMVSVWCVGKNVQIWIEEEKIKINLNCFDDLINSIFPCHSSHLMIP